MNVNELKVLICDDSILIRKKMKDVLASVGVGTILEAANGQEAVDQYKANNPHIVFMDIVMPVKTGIEALTEIKRLDPSAKVIMASSVGTQSHLKTAIEAGAFDFIQKPIENEQLIKIINTMTKK